MHCAKIDFFDRNYFNYYVNNDIDQRCGFVANADSIANILKTTPARKLKFLQKLYEVIDL